MTHDSRLQLANGLFFAQVESMLAEGREVQLLLRGHSMRPLLRSDRDTIVLAPCGADTPLRTGDVVLFRYRGRHILHRIVRIEGDLLTMAGDGNYRLEECCARRDVIGIARSIVRRDGTLLACDSPAWRRRSRLWLSLPAIVRRVLLSLLWRLGYR